jgi:hypothetical protein
MSHRPLPGAFAVQLWFHCILFLETFLCNEWYSQFRKATISKQDKSTIPMSRIGDKKKHKLNVQQYYKKEKKENEKSD